jgi:hypothetical protein
VHHGIQLPKKKRGWPDVVFGGCGLEVSFAPALTSISFGDCNLSINAPTSQSLSSFIRLCIHDDNTYTKMPAALPIAKKISYGVLEAISHGGR